MKDLKKKRMLFLSPASELGGAERCLIDLVKAIEGLGMNTCVILPKEGPLEELLSKETATTIEFIPFPYSLRRLSRWFTFHLIYLYILAIFQVPIYLRYLRRKINQVRPDLIHSNGMKTHILLSFLKTSNCYKTIIHLHELMPKNRLLKFLIQNAVTKLDIVWANSPATADCFLKNRKDINIIPNIVDFNEFYNSPIVSSEKYRLGCFGALTPNKGQNIFLMIINELIKYDNRFEGWIIGSEIYDTYGEKGYYSKLQQLAARLDLQKHVKFIDFQKDVGPLMRKCQFIVHTSLQYESFGRVIIEGMACGRIVIASKVGGPEDIIKQRENGYLVEPGCIEEYVQCIREIVSNPELAGEISKNAIETARKNYGFNVLNRKLKESLRI